MTREEATKILNSIHEEYVVWQARHGASTIETMQALSLAIRALREQGSGSCGNCNSQWISVHDLLPQQGERVLATDGAFVGEMYINKRDQWQRYNVNDSSLMMALDILWWMPLPEPPEGGAEE